MEKNLEEEKLKRWKDKVCIVGCADSKVIVPFSDPEYEFWGVNNLYGGTPINGSHYDRWFEIHTITSSEKGGQKIYERRWNPVFRGQKVNDYVSDLAKLPYMIYMQHRWEEIPNSVAYPINEIVTAFGRYFTNTISYEIALAIMMGYKTIAIYGVDMAVGTEYEKQRPSCEYMIGIAKGLGIEVIIPDEADLLKARFLYAFEEVKQGAWDAKMNMIQKGMSERLAQAQAEQNRKAVEVERYNGAIAAIRDMQKIWGNFNN